MKLNNKGVKVAMARKQLSVKELAELYGCSLNRIHVILNSAHVNAKTAGKLAAALGCDVLDIIENEEEG